MPANIADDLRRVGDGNLSQGIRLLWAATQARPAPAQRPSRAPLSVNDLAEPLIPWWRARRATGNATQSQDLYAIRTMLTTRHGANASSHAPNVLAYLSTHEGVRA